MATTKKNGAVKNGETTAEEVVNPTLKVGPAKVITVALCEGIEASIIKQVQGLCDKEFGDKRIGVESYAGVTASETNPGSGFISITLKFGDKVQAAIKKLVEAEVAKVGCGLPGGDVEIWNRTDITFTTVRDGKPMEVSIVDWEAWAGKKGEETEDMDAFDFSALKSGWLGKSFLKSHTVGEDDADLYWFTIQGLDVEAKLPVVVFCDDEQSRKKTTRVRLSVEDVVKGVTETTKLLEKLKANNPEKYGEMMYRRPASMKKAANGNGGGPKLVTPTGSKNAAKKRTA